MGLRREKNSEEGRDERVGEEAVDLSVRVGWPIIENTAHSLCREARGYGSSGHFLLL